MLFWLGLLWFLRLWAVITAAAFLIRFLMDLPSLSFINSEELIGVLFPRTDPILSETARLLGFVWPSPGASSKLLPLIFAFLFGGIAEYVIAGMIENARTKEDDPGGQVVTAREKFSARKETAPAPEIEVGMLNKSIKPKVVAQQPAEPPLTELDMDFDTGDIHLPGDPTDLPRRKR